MEAKAVAVVVEDKNVYNIVILKKKKSEEEGGGRYMKEPHNWSSRLLNPVVELTY